MRNPVLLPQHPNLLRNRQEKHTPFFKRVPPVVSRLDYYRQHLARKGISERASNLILSSRTEDTNSNYCSSWNKWASWCDKQNIDPFRCTLEWVLDFLAELFEQDCQYRSVCSHRSAISALHEGIDGKSMSENPQVTSLITGIFILRSSE